MGYSNLVLGAGRKVETTSNNDTDKTMKDTAQWQFNIALSDTF